MVAAGYRISVYYISVFLDMELLHERIRIRPLYFFHIKMYLRSAFAFFNAAEEAFSINVMDLLLPAVFALLNRVFCKLVK